MGKTSDHDSTNEQRLRTDWSRRIDPKRPLYDCPNCDQKAMQYFTQSLEGDREDYFRCHACGSNWEM